jgi:hypothetical protein
MSGHLSRYMEAVAPSDPLLVMGKITQVVGLVAEAQGINLPVGAGVYLHTEEAPVLAEVVGFKGSGMLVMPYAETRGLRPGCPVSSAGSEAMVRVGPGLLGPGYRRPGPGGRRRAGARLSGTVSSLQRSAPGGAPPPHQGTRWMWACG